MDEALILSLVKDRIGMRSDARDIYLNAIIAGVLSELEDEKGITLNPDSAHLLMFIVDFSAWRYMNRDSEGAMPRHLQFRLHNMIIREAGVVNDI